jgi:hypothetical protein
MLQIETKERECPQLKVQHLGVLEADPVLTLQLEGPPGAKLLELGVVAPGRHSTLMPLLALKWVQCLS